jgi:tetratricopeptide (TPR) repeat protein
MKIKNMTIACVLFLLVTGLFAEAPSPSRAVWFIQLRDAVYEQELSSSEVLPIFTTARAQAETIVSEHERYIMFARCENLMGQVYAREGEKNEAAAYYKRGESFAKSALKIETSSEALTMQAESIGLLCNIKGLGYQMANGVRFLGIVNSAINRAPDNYEAINLLAACYAFPDPPFHNLNRAKKLLNDILENDNENIHKEVRFNAYYAMGVVCQRQKRFDDAMVWFTKASAIYPTNNDVQQRLKEI